MVISSITLFSQSARFNISTFETVKLPKKGYLNGDNLKGGFVNGHFFYRLNFDTTWNSWSGVAVSNNIDTITNSYSNEYSSITGNGYNGSKNFGVCYNSGTIICEKPTKLLGFYITNTTYTYHTLKNGSAFSKKFGGTSGNDTDWFRVKIVNYLNGKKNDSLYYYLADYRFADNSKDYIVKKWERVDLSASDKYTDSLKITFESTDNGTWGMNTPAYMAFDDFNSSKDIGAIMNFDNSVFFEKGNVWNGEYDTSGGFDIGGFYFENNYDTKWKTWNGWAISKDNDTTQTGLNAQYSSITAVPVTAVSYGRSVIKVPSNINHNISKFIYISNNTYTYKTMKYGDAFSKKFGGESGNDKDFLKLSMISYTDNEKSDTTSFYLADYRNSFKKLERNEVCLTSSNLKNITRIEFQLESSDNGPFGMNTPAYFCLRSIEPMERVNNYVLIKTRVYPNPAKDYILTDIASFDSYQIVDFSGREFSSFTNKDSNKIDIKNLPHGIFLLKITKDNVVYYSRFVK